MTKEKDFFSTTMSKVDTATPPSKGWALTRNITLIVLLVIMVLLGVYLIAAFFEDFYDLLVIQQYLGRFRIIDIFDMMIELVVLSGLLGFGSILLYRTTDWPLVCQRRTLILLVCVFLILGGGGAVALSAEGTFDGPTKTFEMLPYRKDRPKKLLHKLEDRNVFVGKVIDVEPRESRFTVQNNEKTIMFVVDDPSLVDFLKIRKDNHVIIQFQEKEGLLYATDIQLIPRGIRRFSQSHPLPKPVIILHQNAPIY